MTVRTVQRWIADGRLQATRVGSRVRVSRSSLASVTDGPAGTRPAAAITSLLIANRGEVAVRVARTARRMGIRVIGVHAADDRPPDGVDESHAITSYLDADELLGVARRSGATAIHPGYGFLAESAPFAAAVTAAGLTWVGPPPDAIAAMGDKAAARRRAAGQRRPDRCRLRRRRAGRRDADRRGRPHRLPAAGEAVAGWRWQGHAGRERRIGPGRGTGSSAPRGAPVVRRRSAHPRALPRGRAARRDPGPVRRARRRGAPRRARLQRAAAQPEDRRGGAGAIGHARAAGAHGRGGAGGGARLGVRQRRHGRDAPDRCGRVLLPRDEHAPPGRAPRHRGRHRPRPGRGPAAHRRGGDAGGAGPVGPAAHPRSRDRGAPLRRGPGVRVPAGERTPGSRPLAGGRSRRRRRPRGRRGRRPLRPDAGQDHRPRLDPARTRSTACERHSARRPFSASAPTCASCAGWRTNHACARARSGPIPSRAWSCRDRPTCSTRTGWRPRCS